MQCTYYFNTYFTKVFVDKCYVVCYYDDTKFRKSDSDGLNIPCMTIQKPHVLKGCD